MGARTGAHAVWGTGMGKLEDLGTGPSHRYQGERVARAQRGAQRGAQQDQTLAAWAKLDSLTVLQGG